MVFSVKTPHNCPGFVKVEPWGSVCDFCKTWASGHIRLRHMALATGPHFSVCRELQRIKFSHLLSRSPNLINIIASFFLLHNLPFDGAVFQAHIADFSDTFVLFFWLFLVFFISIPLTVILPGIELSATADSLYLQTANVTRCLLSTH